MITPLISNIHAGTPTITVLDNRGLNIRMIQYHRQSNTQQKAQERIEFQHFNIYGFLEQSADARLSESGQCNFYYSTDLIGFPVFSQGADSGDVYQLNDIEERLVISIDANKTYKSCDYEGVNSLGRLKSINEKVEFGHWRVSEYFEYAGHSFIEQMANLAGQCTCHFDTAGLLQTQEVSLRGEPILWTRQFIQQFDNVEYSVDWQGDTCLTALSPEKFPQQISFDATGACLSILDAKGHKQLREYDIAGQLIKSNLTVKGSDPQSIVQLIEYSAIGQKVRELHGNGVVTEYEHEAQTQRLSRIRSYRPANHLLGYKLFQDLYYDYDPVGNVVGIHNGAEKSLFWRNQKVEPKQQYQYDSLYQLIHATGREIANKGQQSHCLPHSSSIDNSIYTQYFRAYSYDKAGNLTQIHHRTPAIQQAYTVKVTVSDRSNRAVLADLAQLPNQVESLFTLSGQQKQLLQGQVLRWTPRQELQSATGVSVSEFYRYDTNSQRVIKITQENQKQSQVIYLPNLEIRQIDNKEKCQVICIGEDKETRVQVLHWELGQPTGIVNNFERYCLNGAGSNHNIELDSSGNLISYEEFYPFGGTAVWAASNTLEANYKTRRYSGQERDITGLYYYGHRYYQPWVGRWLSADPAGTIDGLNLFRMVQNNPLTFKDEQGLAPVLFNSREEMYASYEETVGELLINSAKNPIVANKPEMVANRVISFAQVFYRDGRSKFTYSINLYGGLEIERKNNNIKVWAADKLGYQETKGTQSKEEKELVNHSEKNLFRTLKASLLKDTNVKNIIISQKAKMCPSCKNALYQFREELPKNIFMTVRLRNDDIPKDVKEHGTYNAKYSTYKYKNIDFQKELGGFMGEIDRNLYQRYQAQFNKVFKIKALGKVSYQGKPKGYDRNQPSTSRRH